MEAGSISNCFHLRYISAPTNCDEDDRLPGASRDVDEFLIFGRGSISRLHNIVQQQILIINFYHALLAVKLDPRDYLIEFENLPVGARACHSVIVEFVSHINNRAAPSQAILIKP
jgi:hypothetical protein